MDSLTRRHADSQTDRLIIAPTQMYRLFDGHAEDTGCVFLSVKYTAVILSADDSE